MNDYSLSAATPRAGIAETITTREGKAPPKKRVGMDDALMSDWIAISRSAPFHPHACKGHETERDKRPAREHPLREREKTERLKERIRVLKSDLA
jgi:hypothetical protein